MTAHTARRANTTCASTTRRQAVPYFRHFIAEVVERMREVACVKMAGTAATADSVRWIEELIGLNLSDRESAFFCKRIAEIYSEVGGLGGGAALPGAGAESGRRGLPA